MPAFLGTTSNGLAPLQVIEPVLVLFDRPDHRGCQQAGLFQGFLLIAQLGKETVEIGTDRLLAIADMSIPSGGK